MLAKQQGVNVLRRVFVFAAGPYMPRPRDEFVCDVSHGRIPRVRLLGDGTPMRRMEGRFDKGVELLG